jgi:ABC-2 type transport system ATP-binding protein
LILETRALTKRFGAVAALNACDLAVETGEVFGLLGPNGAGKTTLIRLLLGYLRPTSGTAHIAGHDCLRKSLEVRKLVSYLPAEAALFPHMRGRDVLKFFAEIRPQGNVGRALAIAERLELDVSRRVGFMSTGMKQKLALAATVAAPTPLFILDEPTANLDPTVRSTVLSLVRELRDEGRTVVFSSHVLSEVEEICHRVVILRKGQVVHEQRLAELKQYHRILARLAGSFPPPPAEFTDRVTVRETAPGEVVIDTAVELAPILSWLATMPLTDVRIEPLGLRAVYDRFHPRQAA